MTRDDQKIKSDLIDTILATSLRSILDWKKPIVPKTVGPYFPDAFDAFEEDRRKLMADCLATLVGTEEATLFRNFNSVGEATDIAFSNWQRTVSIAANRLRNSAPPWYAAGFGHPDHVANIDYWSKMEYFELHEAVWLSLGVEPIPKPTSTSMSTKSRQVAEPPRHPVMDYATERQTLFARHFRPTVHGRRVYPLDLLSWVQEIGLEAHLPFQYALLEVQDRKLKLAVGQSKQVPKPIESLEKDDPRELLSLAKILTALAIDQFGYVPDARRSPIPREFLDMAEKLGIPMTQDTILKYLRLGAKHLPVGWNQK